MYVDRICKHKSEPRVYCCENMVLYCNDICFFNLKREQVHNLGPGSQVPKNNMLKNEVEPWHRTQDHGPGKWTRGWDMLSMTCDLSKTLLNPVTQPNYLT